MIYLPSAENLQGNAAAVLKAVSLGTTSTLLRSRLLGGGGVCVLILCCSDCYCNYFTIIIVSIIIIYIYIYSWSLKKVGI